MPASPPPEEVLAQIRNLSNEDVAELSSLLPPLIEHRTGRIEYAENRRTSFAVFGGVLLAAGVAGLVQLAKGGYPYLPTFIALVSFCGSLMIVGGLALTVYARQTNWSYPFKEVTSTWKWFYRDAIPESNQVEEPWHLIQSANRQQRGASAVAMGRQPFVDRTLSLSDAHVNLAQDMEQLYLLHWNEFYKNMFLTHLRKVIVWGVLGALAVGVIGLLVGLTVNCG